MKTRTIILIAVAAFLLLAGIALAQPAKRYAIERGTISGGEYQLTSLSWQVSGTASGGHYRLLCPDVPGQRGSGCCCTYLPLTLRNY